MVKSVASELKNALNELFEVLSVKCIKVETSLEISCADFIRDLMRVIDEIKSAVDIVRLWHIDLQLAVQVFDVVQEVLFEEDTSEDGVVEEMEESHDVCASGSDDSDDGDVIDSDEDVIDSDEEDANDSDEYDVASTSCESDGN